MRLPSQGRPQGRPYDWREMFAKKTRIYGIALQSHLSRGFGALAERFTLTATLSVFKNHKPLSFRASICGFLGLALGMYLLLANGMREMFRSPPS